MYLSATTTSFQDSKLSNKIVHLTISLHPVSYSSPDESSDSIVFSDNSTVSFECGLISFDVFTFIYQKKTKFSLSITNECTYDSSVIPCIGFHQQNQSPTLRSFHPKATEAFCLRSLHLVRLLTARRERNIIQTYQRTCKCTQART